MRDQPEDRFFIVWISNSIKNVPMFQQRVSNDPDSACCWDYHVILLCARATERDVVVYDIDTVLPYPIPLNEYLQRSFPYEWPFPYAPMFRLIPAVSYLRHFASDRMHMFNPQKNTWNAPPPDYDCINISDGRPSNFQRYLDFSFTAANQTAEEEAIFGRILSLRQLAEYPHFFAQESTMA